MREKKPDILSYLVELYKDFYSHKDLFKINFKYSIYEVENYYKQIKNKSDTSDAKKLNEENISEDILSLKTDDDVKGILTINQKTFYWKN